MLKNSTPKDAAIELIKQMIAQKIDIGRSRVLLLGLVEEQDKETICLYKKEFYKELVSFNVEVFVYEPYLHQHNMQELADIILITQLAELKKERPLRRDHRFGKSTRCFDAVVFFEEDAIDELNLKELLDFPALVYKIE